MFLSLPVEMFRSVVLLPLSFCCFLTYLGGKLVLLLLCFVGLVAVVLLTNAMFSLGLLELLVFVAHDIDFGLSS